MSTQPSSQINQAWRAGISGQSTITGKQEWLTSTNGNLNVNLSSLPALAAGTNAIGTVGTTPGAVNVNQKTVNTTAVQLSASATTPTNGITVQALSTNSASVFVGGSGVTTSTGFELQAGQSVAFTCVLNTLYIISVASTTDGVCYNVA